MCEISPGLVADQLLADDLQVADTDRPGDRVAEVGHRRAARARLARQGLVGSPANRRPPTRNTGAAVVTSCGSSWSLRVTRRRVTRSTHERAAVPRRGRCPGRSWPKAAARENRRRPTVGEPERRAVPAADSVARPAARSGPHSPSAPRATVSANVTPRLAGPQRHQRLLGPRERVAFARRVSRSPSPAAGRLEGGGGASWAAHGHAGGRRQRPRTGPRSGRDSRRRISARSAGIAASAASAPGSGSPHLPGDPGRVDPVEGGEQLDRDGGVLQQLAVALEVVSRPRRPGPAAEEVGDRPARLAGSIVCAPRSSPRSPRADRPAPPARRSARGSGRRGRSWPASGPAPRASVVVVAHRRRPAPAPAGSRSRWRGRSHRSSPARRSRAR